MLSRQMLPLAKDINVKAAILKRRGASASFDIEEVPRPEIARDEVLVKLHATSINPVDWQTARAFSTIPNAFLPQPFILGHDFAGVIVQLGQDVHDFAEGQSVFGTNGLALDAVMERASKTGTYSEYTAVKASKIAPMPTSLSFVQAATIPLVALTAYQGLVKAKIKSGDKVLVIGGSGGVGSMVVQIAKAKGAMVTAVCSTANTAMVMALGADEVIDYTTEDYLRCDADYDIVFNTIGHQTASTCSNLLHAHGIYVDCAAPSVMGALGLVRRYASFSSKKNIFFLYRSSGDDLHAIADLIDHGKLKPIIAAEIRLADINQGHALSKTGRVAGKIAVVIDAA